jgi:hypothetical protein
MDQVVLRTLIAAEIKTATAPLEAEIQWLKAEVQSLKAGRSNADSSGADSSSAGPSSAGPSSAGPSSAGPSSAGSNPMVSPVISSEPAPVWNPEPSAEATGSVEESASGLPANVPPDRSDFARFLARGLEQEAKEYAEERPEPEKKKGWNPFKK